MLHMLLAGIISIQEKHIFKKWMKLLIFVTRFSLSRRKPRFHQPKVFVSFLHCQWSVSLCWCEIVERRTSSVRNEPVYTELDRMFHMMFSLWTTWLKIIKTFQKLWLGPVFIFFAMLDDKNGRDIGTKHPSKFISILVFLETIVNAGDFNATVRTPASFSDMTLLSKLFA